ncbi:MAG: hypothetical protein K2Y05_07790 [Hyphomicrobiaceae bacterium]|nr:hypothetical protein [Hyphomicrobiaceae bacterium]
MFDFSVFDNAMKWPVTNAADAWMKSIGRIQVETAALATRRMLAVLEFPQHLARCETPQDVISEQVRFWQIAQRQYMQSLERIAVAASAEAPKAPKVRDVINMPDDVRAEATVATFDVASRQPELKKPHQSAQPIDLRKAKVERPDTEAEVAAWLYKKSA